MGAALKIDFRDPAFCPQCNLVAARKSIQSVCLTTYICRQIRRERRSSGRSCGAARRGARIGRYKSRRRDASNDGYPLIIAQGRRFRLGIEPAQNIAELLKRGIGPLSVLFCRIGTTTAPPVGQPTSPPTTAAHVPRRLTSLLVSRPSSPEGTAVIEKPYLIDFSTDLNLTPLTEHLCYFAVTPLVRLFADAGLQVFDVERIPVHGGSLRLFIRHPAVAPPLPSVSNLLDHEQHWGIGSIATYRRFADRVRVFAPTFRQFVATLRANGHSVAAYGASAKGATLINYCGIGTELLDFVADVSPLKQGRAMPGMAFYRRTVRLRPVDRLRDLRGLEFRREIARQQPMSANGRTLRCADSERMQSEGS